VLAPSLGPGPQSLTPGLDRFQGGRSIWSGASGSLKLFAINEYDGPCERGGTYVELDQFLAHQCLNDVGQFVVMGQYKDDDNVIRTALFAGDPRFNRKHVIAAVGDTVVDRTLTTIGVIADLEMGNSDLSARNNPASGYATINACGVVTFRVRFESGTHAVVTRRLLPADTNGDGLANVVDFITFGTQFAAGNLCAADFDGNDLLNINDYIAFLTAYAISTEECP